MNEYDPIFAPTMAAEEDKKKYKEEMYKIYLGILKRSYAPSDAGETKHLYKKESER